MFQTIAVIGIHAHVGVEVETGNLGAPLAYDRGLGILASAAQAQYTTASARTRRDQTLHGGIGQAVEGQLLIFGFNEAISVASKTTREPAYRSPRRLAIWAPASSHSTSSARPSSRPFALRAARHPRRCRPTLGRDLLQGCRRAACACPTRTRCGRRTTSEPRNAGLAGCILQSSWRRLNRKRWSCSTISTAASARCWRAGGDDVEQWTPLSAAGRSAAHHRDHRYLNLREACRTHRELLIGRTSATLLSPNRMHHLQRKKNGARNAYPPCRESFCGVLHRIRQTCETILRSHSLVKTDSARPCNATVTRR